MIRRVENEPGYVLHSRPWRETSLILEVFTCGHGRLGLTARGARRLRSRLRGMIVPFQPLLLSWAGRGELPTLTGADDEGPIPALRGRALFSGFYLNELLLKLLPRNDAHGALFGHYRDALAGLGAGGAAEPVLRIFEKRLLDALGYGLTLDREADTGAPVSPNRRYRYLPQHGPVGESGAAAGEKGVAVSGRTLLALARGRFEDGDGEARARQEARSLMRAILAPHLGPRPLGSRQLFAPSPPAGAAAGERGAKVISC